MQYASHEYIEQLQVIGAQISMSAVGNPYDNAKAERFFKTLKVVVVLGRVIFLSCFIFFSFEMLQSDFRVCTYRLSHLEEEKMLFFYAFQALMDGLISATVVSHTFSRRILGFPLSCFSDERGRCEGTAPDFFSIQVEQASFKSGSHGGGSIRDRELGKQVEQVGFDSGLREIHRPRNLFVTGPARDQRQNF